MTLVVNLLYTSYKYIPSEYIFNDLQVPKGQKTADFFSAYTELVAGARKLGADTFGFR